MGTSKGGSREKCGVKRREMFIKQSAGKNNIQTWDKRTLKSRYPFLNVSI